MFRIGGDRYAEENGSHGLMTLQRGAGVRPGWPATQGGFEAAVSRLLRD